jgi:hypothetical protein
VSCPLCNHRKGRRQCPAREASICSACCGSKRRVEIDCPADCVYLTGAHAAGWEGRTTERERDQRRITPQIVALNDEHRDLYLLALLGLTGLSRRRPDINDQRVADALAALRKTVETRTRGLLYEHPAEDARAQALIPELSGLFEAHDSSGRVVAPSDADLLPVLLAIERSLRTSLSESTEPRAFLELAARLTAGLSLAPPAEPPRIVTP